MTDIADVAREAGVSTATVSRALRGLPNVAEPTRRRVLDSARRLGYRISRTASGLATGRTGTVAIVVPNAGRWFFGQVIDNMAKVLRTAGLDLLLYSMDDDDARERFFHELPVHGRADAIVVLCIPLRTPEAEALGSLGVPVSLLGCEWPGFGSVRIDDELGTRLAVRHLLNLGHERIAIICGDEPAQLGFTTPATRLSAYRETLREAGVEPRHEWEAPGHFTMAGGATAMNHLLAAGSPPTAVFAMSDEMAAGALRSLRRHGLSAPDDMSVVGFDGHELADLLDLTTVSQDVALQGIEIAELTLSLLDGLGEVPQDRIMPVRLVVRSSTAGADRHASREIRQK